MSDNFLAPRTFEERVMAALPLGLPVFPIAPRDKIVIPGIGCTVATRDPNVIAGWIKKYPDANIGMVGRPDGYWILDCDRAGIRERIEAETGQRFPRTFTVCSSGAKRHYYFKQNEKSAALGNLPIKDEQGEVLSVRGDNLYVVGPGSWHPNPEVGADGYQIFDDVPITEAPEWLIDWLSAQENHKTIEDIPRNKSGKIPHGSIYEFMKHVACKLRNDDLNADEIEVVLMRRVHEACEPPIDDEKVRRMARWAGALPAGQGTGFVRLGPPKPEPVDLWEAPQIFADVQPAVPPFELDFLPDSLQGWAKDIAYRTSVPLDFTGICALVSLAGCVGRRAFVYPKKNDKEWKEALAVSGMVVATSGALKTPTWKPFMNVLMEQQVDWQEEHDEVETAYQQAWAQWKASGNPEGEPEEPAPSRRLIANDATPEKLHAIMGHTPEGLCMYRDELSSWMTELNQPGRDAQLGIMLAAMNGDDNYTLDRIKRGSITAKMCASLFGGIQPSPLTDFLNESRNIDNGLVPRFGLAVWPDVPVNQVVIDKAADEDAKERFRAVVRALASLPAEAIYLHFNPEAQTIFNKWLTEITGRLRNEKHTGMQSHMSKYRGLLPKLAGLLQLADLVTPRGDVPLGNQIIDAAHLNRALRLLAYLETHMVRIYAVVKSELQKAEESLAEHIENGDLKDGFTAREISRKCWGNLKKEEVVDSALATMADAGWIRVMMSDKKTGRPTVRYQVNPRVLKSHAKGTVLFQSVGPETELPEPAVPVAEPNNAASAKQRTEGDAALFVENEGDFDVPF